MIKTRTSFPSALLVFAFTGCSSLDTTSGLVHSHGSMEALAQSVLNALEERNGTAIREHLVTRQEHRNLLWDHLPESKNLPFDYARLLNERNSYKGIDRAIKLFGGQDFEVLGVTFDESATEAYDGFTIRLVKEFSVRRSDGIIGTLPLLDVVIERRGQWKLLNFDEL